MERLTKVTSSPDGTKIYDISNELFKLNTSRADKTRMLLEKLAEYEDLEEQGRLIKLPCKWVYFIADINRPKYATVMRRPIRQLAVYEIEDLDKDDCIFFSTIEKAEAKLKELRGGVMKKYKCIKEFYVSKYDEDDVPTDEYITIHKGSIYEHTEGYIGESDIRLYLEDGDDDCDYLDITYKRLEEYFERSHTVV